jgi:hypothetical protein
MEEKHRLVPRRHFRAWDIPSFSPCVSLAFNNEVLLFISEVKVVCLPYFMQETINKRSSDLFPIGSSKPTYLPPFCFVVYKILDSNPG